MRGSCLEAGPHEDSCLSHLLCVLGRYSSMAGWSRKELNCIWIGEQVWDQGGNQWRHLQGLNVGTPHIPRPESCCHSQVFDVKVF